jgi:hypothetical protein
VIDGLLRDLAGYGRQHVLGGHSRMAACGSCSARNSAGVRRSSIPSSSLAERALRGFALGRKAWLFAGSERGADRAAAMTTLIMTAKLNDVDPQAWLADVLSQIADIPQGRLAELLPWNWKQPNLKMVP